MENNDNIVMSRIAFERIQAKEERNDHFKNMTIIIMAILLAISLILLALNEYHWRKIWSEYDYVDEYSIEAQQDGEGINIVGGGDIDYGTDSNDTQETEQNTQE